MPNSEDRAEIDQQDILIRGIAHDINNNLMAVLGVCDRLETSPNAAAHLPESLKLIRTHLDMVTSQLRDLVDSHHLDEPMVMSEEELRHFLTSILPSLGLVAGEDTRIELGPVVVTGDVPIPRKPLLRVLLQLARNVAETGAEHPLALISVRQLEDRWCEISVSDNGPGVSSSEAERIFRPGVSTKAAGGDSGRGYGLSAIAGAVENWGGEYGVDAIEGGGDGDGGARFWVRLPITD